MSRSPARLSIASLRIEGESTPMDSPLATRTPGEQTFTPPPAPRPSRRPMRRPLAADESTPTAARPSRRPVALTRLRRQNSTPVSSPRRTPEFSGRQAPSTPSRTGVDAAEPWVVRTPTRVNGRLNRSGGMTPDPSTPQRSAAQQPIDEMNIEEREALADQVAAFWGFDPNRQPGDSAFHTPTGPSNPPGPATPADATHTPAGASHRRLMSPPELKRRRFTDSPNQIYKDAYDGTYEQTAINLSFTGMPLCSTYQPRTNISYVRQIFHNREQLGAGSFGTVLKLQKITTKEHTAVKIQSLSKVKSLYACVRESFFLEHINHPNVIRFEGAWEEGGLVHIQTELCSQSLYDMIVADKVLFPQPFIWNCLVDTLRGLSYMHARHVLHLDIKPHNLLVCASGIIKLADLGSAYNWKKESSESGDLEGDGRYLAPEAFDDDVAIAATDKRDIFSLGATAFQVATKCDYKGHGPEMGMARRKAFEAEDIARCPPTLFRIILVMLETDPQERPSIGDLFAMPEIAENECRRQQELAYLGIAIPAADHDPIPDESWELLQQYQKGDEKNRTIA